MKERAKKSKETKAKISQTMLGLKNAEYWTAELVEETLDKMISFLLKDTEVEVSIQEELTNIKFEESDNEELYKEAKQIKYIVKRIKTRPHLKKECRLEFRIFDRNWFFNMSNTHKDNLTIMGLLSAIDDICEVNSYKAAASGTANSTIVKMNLSHHYGWAETSKVETKNVTEKTDEELDKEIADYERSNKQSGVR